MNLQKFEMEIRKRARTDKSFFRHMTSVGSSDLDRELVVESTCKPEKISSIFRCLDPHKANILNSIGFGGLLKIPLLENLCDDLSLWLYQRFDLTTMCLHLDGGVDLFLRDADVFLIFGIPFDGRLVNFGLNQSVNTIRAFQDKILANTSSSVMNMAMLEEIVTKEYGPTMSAEEIDAFIIASVLISMAYLLAPEAQPDFPIHLIKNFVPDVLPKEINWAQFVLWTIGRSAFDLRLQITSGAKKISMFGCTLLLQVFYLDNLNFGPCTPYHIVLPRASAYYAEMMRKLIGFLSSGLSHDKVLLFGSKEIRPAIDVCYTRGWLNHVDMHTELEQISIVDYLTSIEILSEGIHLIDIFGPQFCGFNSSILDPSKESLVDIESSYLKFKSLVNDNIHNLFAKAAVIVKNRIMTLYHQHIPQEICTSSSMLVPIGGLDGEPYRRADGQNSACNRQMTSPMMKVVSTHSNFEDCPFGPSFKHPDVTFTNKARCFLWLSNPCLPTDELNRNWIVFMGPRELLIPGHAVQNCLKANGNFDISLVDAIMVLWNYLDGKLYTENNLDKRWRHFLPASFAEMVNQNCDYLNSDAIRSSFIGQHINYDVEECQQIIIPVCDNRKTWSCYIWDFKHKTITVLDPILMNSPNRRVKVKHQNTVFKLHDALVACIDNFFSGWDIAHNGWIDLYLTDVGKKSKAQNSGLYAVNYARALCDGKLVLNLINETTVSEGRGEILYHMLECEENKGYKPESLMEEIHCSNP